MQKSIIIGGDVYSIASLCRKYNFSYKKASHLYNQGYRGEELLNKLKKDQIEGQIIIDGKVLSQDCKLQNTLESPLQLSIAMKGKVKLIS